MQEIGDFAKPENAPKSQKNNKKPLKTKLFNTYARSLLMGA
jgi:hypothetical protein